jgi:hypothetical protein
MTWRWTHLAAILAGALMWGALWWLAAVAIELLRRIA